MRSYFHNSPKTYQNACMITSAFYFSPSLQISVGFKHEAEGSFSLGEMLSACFFLSADYDS